MFCLILSCLALCGIFTEICFYFAYSSTERSLYDQITRTSYLFYLSGELYVSPMLILCISLMYYVLPQKNSCGIIFLIWNGIFFMPYFLWISFHICIMSYTSKSSCDYQREKFITKMNYQWNHGVSPLYFRRKIGIIYKDNVSAQVSEYISKNCGKNYAGYSITLSLVLLCIPIIIDALIDW